MRLPLGLVLSAVGVFLALEGPAWIARVPWEAAVGVIPAFWILSFLVVGWTIRKKEAVRARTVGGQRPWAVAALAGLFVVSVTPLDPRWTWLGVPVFAHEVSMQLVVTSLAYAFTIGGLLAAASRGVGRTVLETLGRTYARLLRLRDPWVLPLVLAVSFAALTATLSHTIFGAIPHVQDSISQYFQSKLFAKGAVTAAAHPLPDFFFVPYTILDDAGRWYSFYPPGHIAMLTLGQWAGAPWLVNPLLGAATLPVVFALARETHGSSTARLSALLVLASPFVLFMSSEYMNHATGLLCTSLLLWAYARALRTRSLPMAVLAGCVLGLLFLTRPLTAVAVALPVVLHAFLHLRPAPSVLLRISAGVLLGFLPCVAVQAAYNEALTGSPWTHVYEEFHGEGYSIGFFELPESFTPLHPEDTAHTPVRGLRHTSNNLVGINYFLLQWPVPALLVALLGVSLARRGVSRRTRTRSSESGPTGDRRARQRPHRTLSGSHRSWSSLFLGIFLSVTIAYLFYFYQDWCFGPRFLYESSGVLLVLVAHAGARLPGWIRIRFRARSRVAHGSVALAFLLPVAYAVALSVPRLAAHYANDYWGVEDENFRRVQSRGLSNALVFVSPYPGQPAGTAYRRYRTYATLAPPSDSDPVIYAIHHGQESRPLIEHYPNRRVFIEMNGDLRPAAQPAD